MDKPFYVLAKGDFALGIVYTDPERAIKAAAHYGASVTGPFDHRTGELISVD